MKYLAIVALLMTSSVQAENWKQIDVTNDGTIVEIDIDSIQRKKDGTTTVDIGRGTMVLDCKGRMGNGVMMIHIPESSIGWFIERAVCKK